MRTTLDIDDDVLAAAKELSRQRRCSAGKVVSQLLRQALTSRSGAEANTGPGANRSSIAGFRPFASRGKPVTQSTIDNIRDHEGI